MSTTDSRATASTTNSGAGSTGGSSEGGQEGGRLGTVRQSAADAYESARDTARSAGRKTAEGIDSNPMAAVVGGLALGAIAAALIPRTQREEQLLGAAGRKVTGTAREAANAARDAARQQIDELGLSKDGVQRRLHEFTDKAVGAVKSSAGAASGAVKNKAGE